MGITTRVKGDMAEKKPFNFALFWDKYGTFFILAIIVAIFGTLSSEYFLTTNNIGNGADRDGRILCHPCRGY